MADELVVLSGGSRDGESTTVAEGVRRLLAASDAPGLLDVYEADGRTQHVPGNDQDALVFVMVDQDSAEGVAPELLHAPLHHHRPTQDRETPDVETPDPETPGASPAGSR